MIAALARGARSFGRFWWQFLVGDSPDLLVATAAIVGLAFALRHQRALAVVTLPLLVAAALTASAWRGRRRTGPSADPTAGEPRRSPGSGQAPQVGS